LLTHPTLDQLHHLGLHGMAKAFADIEAGGEAASLGHAEWLALLLEREASLRRDKRLSKRLQYAKLRQQACVEDIDYRTPKPNSQNASCPGRHQFGTVGEIISESWARSNRYTRARSSESATFRKRPDRPRWRILRGRSWPACGITLGRISNGPTRVAPHGGD
jgi:IstB-like ATP binding protein